MSISDLFWEASLDELKDGFTEDSSHYICLLCGKKIEKGIIYKDKDVLYEARKFMLRHIESIHQSVFHYLLQLDKKATGLSEHQSSLLRLFYQGMSDAEVQSEMGIGSSSTIRNHRFALKEKERQAKVFLVLMELLRNRDRKGTGYIPPHSTAKMVDDRYHTTGEESEKILKKYFPHGLNGPITTFDMKEKSKLVVLRQILRRFQPKTQYSEKEINEILKTVYEDHVTLRRYLVEYGFLDRKPDGSVYWVKESPEETGKEMEMDRKKELRELYKEIKIEAGVFQIKNTQNQKIFVDSTPNLKTLNGKKMQLNGGSFKNKQLQEDWLLLGEAAFVFEVLEVLQEKEGEYFDKKEELKKLEGKWLDNLKPYGDRGYNVEK